MSEKEIGFADWFAGLAMQSLITNGDWGTRIIPVEEIDQIVDEAWWIAEAMERKSRAVHRERDHGVQN